MACLAKIARLPQIKQYLSFARTLTSQNAPLVSTIPSLNFVQNPWIWQENNKIDLPRISKVEFNLPDGLKYIPISQEPKQIYDLELPPFLGSDEIKEAARLIVIRKNKMKRHKLKKLRKRMKYEWAKRRQRRELKKEKAFQAILIKQCKDAEAFSAEQYVQERLSKLNEVTGTSKSLY